MPVFTGKRRVGTDKNMQSRYQVPFSSPKKSRIVIELLVYGCVSVGEEEREKPRKRRSSDRM